LRYASGELHHISLALASHFMITTVNSSNRPSGELYQQVSVLTQYLEMTSPPLPATPSLPETLACVRWFSPDPQEYLALYNEVGAPWGWSGRLRLGEQALAETLSSPGNRVYRLYETACNAAIGFFELDVENPKSVEIVYLGLSPESIGKGYGKYLLNASISHAWSEEPKRVWLHTCEFDHVRALEAYKRCGFVQYDERVEMEYYPRAFLETR
jgi:GNAT superfamily N-acetyltransferase